MSISCDFLPVFVPIRKLNFAKSKENNQELDFTYTLYNANNTKVPNSVMIADENEEVRIDFEIVYRRRK